MTFIHKVHHIPHTYIFVYEMLRYSLKYLATNKSAVLLALFSTVLHA